MDPKIQTKELDFFYGKLKALNRITLDIKEYHITALIGPSGCGKTTFLRLLNRMNDIIPTTRLEGEVLLDGQNIYDPQTDVVEIRKRVGMVFQQPNPFLKSIYDNVAFGPRMLRLNHKIRLDEVVEESLKAAALWDEVKDKLEKPGQALSG
ncbi:MAG TPA: phosphate ABC transporter ATP-binding protein, partial [Desulfotomaculum sp.]|nr:phosphate ABC transporter ATP-binding protein [Desulfotomaculum sp.]